MDNLQKYKPTDKMIDLISDNYSLLQVISDFRWDLVIKRSKKFVNLTE